MGVGGLAIEGVPPWPPVSLRVGDQVAELAALGGQATKSPAQQFAVAGVGEGVQGPFGRWPVRLVSCAAMKPALASCSRSRASARSLAWVPLPLPWAPMMMYLRIPPPRASHRGRPDRIACTHAGAVLAHGPADGRGRGRATNRLALRCWVASRGWTLGTPCGHGRRDPDGAVADRGLHGHRRYPDRGAGQPGRFDRLVVPSRFDGRRCRDIRTRGL